MPRLEDVIYAVNGPIGVITLNGPAYRNAQSYRTLAEIDKAFRLARADDEVRVVVGRGSGSNFERSLPWAKASEGSALLSREACRGWPTRTS